MLKFSPIVVVQVLIQLLHHKNSNLVFNYILLSTCIRFTTECTDSYSDKTDVFYYQNYNQIVFFTALKGHSIV